MNRGAYGTGLPLSPGPTAGVDCIGLLGTFGGQASPTPVWRPDDPTASTRAGVYVEFAGTIRKLYAKINAGYGNFKVNTFTVRVNEVATSCLITTSTDVSGDYLGTGEATFEAGDYIDVQWSVTDGPNDAGPTIEGLWCEMETTGGHFTVYGCEDLSLAIGDWRNRDDYGGAVAGHLMVSAPLAGSGLNPVTTGASNEEPSPILAIHPEPSYQLTASNFRFANGGTFISSTAYLAASGSPDYPGITQPLNPLDNVSATHGLSVNGAAPTTIYTTYNYSPLNVDDVWQAETINIPISSGDEVSWWLNRYVAPVAYTGILETARNNGGISWYFLTVNFQSDSSDELDVIIPVFGPYDYVSPDYVTEPIVPLTTTGGGWSSIINPVVNIDDYEGTYDQAITMPSCTGISRLRAYCWQHTSGSCTITLYAGGEPLEQFIVVDGTGWFEYSGTVSKIAAGCTVAVHWAYENWDGVITMMGYTQAEAFGCPACGSDVPDQFPPCRCPDDNLHLDELATEVIRMVGEVSGSLVYWSADEIDRAINDAYLDVCRDTKALELIEAVNLTADSPAASLSSYVGQIFRVTWEDKKIDNATKWELDRIESDWESQAGTVSNYVTTLQDNRAIATYKAWDGTAYNSDGPYNRLEAYEYETWTLGTAYTTGTRAIVTQTSGRQTGYVCLLSHTATAARKPESGASWETYWEPLILMVWATKHPPVLTNDDYACPVELPAWCNLGLAYEAASRLLSRYGEQGNPALAAAYKAIADDYWNLLKAHVANRTPERAVAMGGTSGRGIRKPRPWDTLIEES